ncbi:MAG: hypothetical protein AAGA63_12060 [Pseudomonadota bacterium]
MFPFVEAIFVTDGQFLIWVGASWGAVNRLSLWLLAPVDLVAALVGHSFFHYSVAVAARLNGGIK